jgi:ADP-heptose:LPS heptosyltransferase
VRISGLLLDRNKYQQLVFLGPEEDSQADEIRSAFGDRVAIVRGLNLSQIAAALGELDLLVSNDTGPTHLAAIVGTPIVLIMDERAPLRYLPLAERIRVVRNGVIDDISVTDVYSAVTDLLEETETNAFHIS